MILDNDNKNEFLTSFFSLWYKNYFWKCPFLKINSYICIDDLILDDMKRCVAYYRVSTKKQGLGIDAQKTICEGYSKQNNCDIIAEYQEKESGTHDDRAELQKAIELCKKENAVLLVAKIDRLSRNMLMLVKMFTDMSQDGVKFVVCDLPELTPLTLGIFAGLAQQERQLISERTKLALEEKKRQGVKLGSPKGFTEGVQNKGLETRQANARNNDNNKKAHSYAQLLREKGFTDTEIVKTLNEQGYKTRRNNSWQLAGVRKLFKLYEK